MTPVRIAFAVVLGLLAASSAPAAPAPFTKPVRHAPAPEALLAELRAEGYLLRTIERGQESGTYVVTMNVEVIGLGENTCAYATRKWTVRTDGPDVRAEIRAILKAAPKTVVYRRYEFRPRVPVRPVLGNKG